MEKARTSEIFPPATKIFYILAVLLALWTAIFHFSFERATEEKDPYLVETQVQRLSGVASVVPRDALVGFTSDLPPESVAFSATFNATAYALAPRLLVKTLDRKWVVGNFSTSHDFAAFARERGLQVVQDFGNGVVVFQRSGQ